MKLAKAFLFVFLVLLGGTPLTQLIAEAQASADTVSIVAPDTLIPLGKSFKMSVETTNSVALWKMIMNFALKDTDLVRLDSFLYSDPSCRLYDPETLDARTCTLVAPDIIEMMFEEPFPETDYLNPGKGKIIDLWFSNIKDGVFFFEKESLELAPSVGPPFVPDFTTDSVRFPSHEDPGNSDSLWIKKGLEAVRDTIGINAKFPLPFTAFTDEILSGFEIPLVITGNNVPTFHRLTFEGSDLRDTSLIPHHSTLVKDSTVLIRLELKKQLSDTLLEPGEADTLFSLWLKADSVAGSCSIYSAFVPHLSNLFFIDDTGGFTPYSSGIVCTTFSYIEGDITRNDVVNNVDLFYLAVHLFLPPDDTSMGKLRYDPEDLERIESQRAFERTQIPSEEWDSTFSEILFRGDVNGDSRVDVGDFYVMSRHFQGGTSDDLEYGWSDPQALGLCNNDTVRLNFRKAYPGQKIQILVEIYNQDSLAAVTIPLHIPDITKLECYSVTLAGRFADLDYFDWEWITWDEDYDQDTTNQDILISLSTLGINGFPHIPPSDSNYADSAFILWCTVKDTLLDKSYIQLASLSPSHEISFFDVAKGYACQPHVHKFMVPTPLADYGDAPDCTNPCYAGCSFPTLCNTNCCRICGWHGAHHVYVAECIEWLGSFADPAPTAEWTALIEDMDQDDLINTLYAQDDTTAWYIVPVTVKADTEAYRYLNVLYDVDGDREWKKDGYTEWVVQNKLIIPSDAVTESIVIGAFEIDQPPSSSDTSWARFTLTRDSIPTALFDIVGGWDGSGPPGGWQSGETEDIPFTDYISLENTEIFAIELDASSYIVGAEGISCTVNVINPNISELVTGSLRLTYEVYQCTSTSSTIEFDSLYFGKNPEGFGLGEHDTVTFIYLATFTDLNGQVCRVQWKVSRSLNDTTTLVASEQAEFVESADPSFVFVDTSGNPITLEDPITISYYGGAVDLRFRVDDPDGDYPIDIIFERDVFQGAGVIYPPVFGLLDDLTKVFDDASEVQNTASVESGDILFFHWAADTTEIGTRHATFRAQDNDGESSDTSLTIVTDSSWALLPPEDKVWIGRTGTVGSKGAHFKVPVEAYNEDTLHAIKLPCQIVGDIDSLLLLGWSFGATARLETLLTYRDTVPQNPPVHTDTVITNLFQHPDAGLPLPPGFGRIFELWFKGDTTTFQINALEPIEFITTSQPPDTIHPAFESYEIKVIQKGTWVCGDADVESPGVVGLGDVVFLINYVLKSGPAPEPLGKGDVNCDGVVDIVDVSYLINYFFKGGECPKQCYGCIPPEGC